MEEKNRNKKKRNKNVSKKKTTKTVDQKKEVELIEQKEAKQENKKDNKKVENNKQSKKVVTNSEMLNLIKIVLVITAIFLIFYGITTIVTKNNQNDNNSGEATIQYDEILLGTLFEQPNSEYYVLITKEDDYYISAYSSLMSVYKTEEDSIRFYIANLDNGFNKSYEAEESNTNTNNLSELKLKGSTLLKIKDKKIVASYEENTAIIEHLNSLLK